MRRIIWTLWMMCSLMVLSLAWPGWSVAAKGKGKGPPSNVPARATFRDVGADRIQSDGKSPQGCTGQYADVDDPCQPGDGVTSIIHNTGSYLLRTVSIYDPHPTRYLVLDFTEGLDGSACPNLDELLSNYPGRSPEATSPVNPEECIDFVEVRFRAGTAFTMDAEYTSINITIDGPDFIEGRGKKPDKTQWNPKYYFNFVNPLRITPDPTDPDTVILSTMEGLEQTELWTVNPKTGDYETLVGRYRMPFEVTLVKVTPETQ